MWQNRPPKAATRSPHQRLHPRPASAGPGAVATARTQHQPVDSGLRLTLAESHDLPLVSGWLIARAGSRYEAADKLGLAEIAVKLMRDGGVSGKTRAEIDTRLRANRSRGRSWRRSETRMARLSMPPEHIEEVLALVHGMVAAPALSVEAFESIEADMGGNIAARNQSGDGIVTRELRKGVFAPDLSYGRVLEYDHLERIERDDAAGWIARYFQPRNSILALHGDFRTQQLAASIERLFAAWRDTQEPPQAPPDPALRRLAGSSRCESPIATGPSSPSD